ncbi:hypothetical protein IT570_07465 [Candidatus Sumerlaeota bacterium]|nr:hypothetical protein [Candidatus Sumerlaeota bacterium]
MNLKTIFLGLAVAGVASTAPAQITTLWSRTSTEAPPLFFLPGSGGIPANTSNTRCATYDGVRDRIYVASRDNDGSGGPYNGIAIVDPANGNLLSTTQLAGSVSGGIITLTAIDVDDDVAAPKLYFMNLVTDASSSAVKIYRLTDPTSAGTLTTVFNATIGDATRFGDTLQVVGSGTSTEIWIGSNSVSATLPQLVRLTTIDGDNFTVSDKFFENPPPATNRIRLGLAVLGTIGPGQKIYGNTTGQQPVVVSIGSTGLAGTVNTQTTAFTASSTSISSIGIAEFGASTYVTLGAGGTIAQETQVWDVTGTPVLVGAAPTIPVVGATNANAIGASFFDTTRRNAVTFVTNASLSSFSISPTLTVNDWTMY